MSLKEKLNSDYTANKDSRKGLIIVFAYRIANYFYYHKNRIVKLIGFPVRKFRSLIFKYIMGIEIPDMAKIGYGLCIWHGNGLIIHPEVTIGNNVTLRHNITIGNKGKGTKCPTIGNNVEIGAQSIIIGEINICDNVTIGAGTVLTKSVPANSIVYGNPIIIKPKSNI